MAVPSYTEDLTDIDLAESTTGYVAYGGGGAGLGTGADLSMQGTLCVDKQITNTEKGILFNNGAGITFGTGDHVFVWLFNATPGLTDTLANRGAVICIGSATTAFCKYHVEGLDTYGAIGRVGKCYPIDPTVFTSNTGSVPYRTLVGTPSGTFQYFGNGLNTTGTVKGANLGLDATRYGTGAYLTAGELISDGDASDDPCTFDGYATQSDTVNNRWSLLTKVGSSTYELQGIFAIGQNNAGTATLCKFLDTDINITIVDTPHSATNFTQFIIDHASTVGGWTNINLTAEGTNNKGLIDFKNASTIFPINGGVFTGISATILNTAIICTGVTWRATDLITLNGGALTDCIIENLIPASSVLASTLNNITGCSFVSDGSNHAVELDSIGAGSMSWDNVTSGYDAGAAGSPITPTSTGNEDIYVNVATASDLTINVTSGATVPSIRVGASFTGSVNVVAGTVTQLVTVSDDGSLSPIQYAAVTIKAATGGPLPFDVTVTITQSAGVATVSHTAHGLETGNKIGITESSPTAYNGIKTITVTGVNSYTYAIDSGTSSPATGVIKATAIIIDGETNVSGQISDTRTYATDQPYTGLIQRGTRQPIYKARTAAGTISSTNGDSLNVLLTQD